MEKIVYNLGHNSPIPMKMNSIRARLFLLLIAFAVLAAIAFGATFWSLESQKQDVLLVNLAGRQRMLLQQIQREASQIPQSDQVRFAPSLREATASFEQTLDALQQGGLAPDQPDQFVQIQPAANPQIQKNLENLRPDWAQFSGAVSVLLDSPSDSERFAQSAQTIYRLFPSLLAQTEAIVRLYKAEAEAKVSRLRLIQTSFLLAAILLLGAGSLVVTRSVTQPLRNLEQSANQIEAGDLSAPISVSGSSEVALLSETMDRMRQELKNLRAELFHWNEHLEQRVAQRTNELEALNQVSSEIASRLELPQVLHSVVAKTSQLLEAEAVFLCMVDNSSARMRLQATLGPEGAIQATSASTCLLPINQALNSDMTLSSTSDDCHCTCQILHPQYRTSQLAAPLRSGQSIIGALCVGSRKTGAFPAEAETLLTRLAVIAAIAIENARLYAQAELAASLEERQCIAAEIHDGLAQTLSYLQLLTDQITQNIQADQNQEALRQLSLIQTALDRAIVDTRRALTRLQAQEPLREVLQDQIELLVEEVSSRSSATIEWSSAQTAPIVLSHQDNEQILRVAQEALNNACKHSHAAHITVCLEVHDQEYALIVQDDGRGFEPGLTAHANGHNHFGLKIMQARAARVGGRLSIDSRAGCGTRVTLIWSKAN